IKDAGISLRAMRQGPTRENWRTVFILRFRALTCPLVAARSRQVQPSSQQFRPCRTCYSAPLRFVLSDCPDGHLSLAVNSSNPHFSRLAPGAAVKLIRHPALRHLRAAPPRQSPVARTRFETLIYLKGFGAGACGGHGFNEQIFWRKITSLWTAAE